MPAPNGGPFSEPLTVVFVEGEVVVLGPAHLHGSLTADAARQTAARLAEMAGKAELRHDGGEEPEL